MKTYCGAEVYLQAIIALEQDGGEWSASLSGHFTPGIRAPGSHWIRGWVDPRGGLDAVAKSKKFHNFPCRGLNPGRPARSLVSISTEALRLLVLIFGHLYLPILLYLSFSLFLHEEISNLSFVFPSALKKLED
jgi:hypothetical protein